jgi:gliding motility-associated-like protein
MVSNISYADTGNRYTVLVKSFCDSVWSGNVQIGVFPVPDPGLPDSTLLCINVGYIESLGFVKYLWNTGATINRIPVPVDGTYTVAVTDYNNCTNKDTTYVKLKAQPSLDAGPDTVLCNELSLQLAATASNYDSVKWTSESSGVYSNRSSLVPIFTPNTGEEGVKNLVLSAYNGCGVTTDQLTVTLKRKTSAAFTPEDTVVCEGSRPVRLIPDNPGGLFTAMYLTHDSFIPQQKGLYITKYIISENGCTDSSTQLIRVVAVPSSSFGYSKGLLSIDSAVTFIPTSTNAQQYVWYFDNGDTSETDTVVYRYTKEGLYRVKLVSINEMCSDTLTEDILILGSNHIWIPNVFTPDGDGLNDIFKTVYINHRGGTLSIYNRWGQRVYISNDLTAGWDGTYAGQNCVSDVYVYVVDYLTNEGSVKQLKGNVTLLR